MKEIAMIWKCDWDGGVKECVENIGEDIHWKDFLEWRYRRKIFRWIL